METQIFMDADIKNICFDGDNLEQWKQKVEELNLLGQLSLLEDGQKSPVPFMYMNTAVERIVNTLCPRYDLIEKYNKSPIPLEALGVFALAQKEKYFDEIRIYYNDSDPDPIMVGKKENNKYLMAKWDEEKKTIEELKQLAKIKRYNEEKHEHEDKLKMLDGNIERFFNGDYVNL